VKIVIATDGSRGGLAAVRFAARLASTKPETELVILTVEERRNGGPPKQEPGVADRAAKAAGAVLASAGLKARYCRVTPGPRADIPETISREADRLKADLVVVGSEGRDTLSEWVVGGTALRLIYVARRPVAVVRPPRKRRKEASVA